MKHGIKYLETMTLLLIAVIMTLDLRKNFAKQFDINHEIGIVLSVPLTKCRNDISVDKIVNVCFVLANSDTGNQSLISHFSAWNAC